MRTLKSISVILTAAFFTIGAGILPQRGLIYSEETRSIDLIFATGFESIPVASLSSETPFNGALPTLETGHESVGATTGSFNVDQTGQASYSIPIFAGVGTAGVSPQVSLQYSSAGGNSHVGVGWSISGVTLITRCRETAESKDVAGTLTPSPITFGTEDKFCLNGERLFVSNGGTYGADGTEYRTEKEQFARITSIGGTGNNPDSFSVERIDGSISFYGDTTDSNITVSHSSPSINGKTYSWAISRYKDSMDNYIDYSYNKLSNSEFVLTDIDYTGNASVVPELLPYNNIHFVYEARVDEFSSYLGGVEFATTQRLAQIQSSIDGTQVRDYTLLYDLSTTSSRSILTSVQECRGATCFPALNFTWSEPDRQFKSSTSTNGSFPNDIKSSKLGDANGDARADLVFVDESENAFKVAYAGGQAGFGLTASTGIAAPAGTEIDNKWHLIDYNADGKQDLMKQQGGQWVIHLAQAFGLNATPIFTGLNTTANSDFQVVDINGDGLADLVHENSSILQVRYLERTGSGYEFSNTLIDVDLPNNPGQIPGVPSPGGVTYLEYRFYQDDDIVVEASDVNGDGVADLILRTDVYQIPPPTTLEGEEIPYRFVSAGEELGIIQGEPVPELISSHWVAFVANGIDGSGDLDYYTETHYITETSSLADDADKHIKFADFNADGLTDVIARNTANNWRFRVSNGLGFDGFQTITTIQNEDHIQIFDHDRDGYLDLVYPSTATNRPYIYRRWTGDSFSSANLLTGAQAINVNSNVNLFMDFDGDGAADHLRIEGTGIQRLYPREKTFKSADQITSFEDSLGAITNVLYRPLTFSTTYKQGNHQTTALNYGLGSPVLDLMAAIYVVRQIEVDAPIEGDETFKNTIRYRYENARVQTGGRGFLGFEKVITATPVKSADDTEAKILESVTTYRQDFPFNGIPSGVEVRQLDENFYDNEPPTCNGDDDTCLPEPCLPGEVCEIIPRGTTGTLVSEIINSVDSNNPTTKSTFAYIDSTETKTYDPETGTLLKTVEQTSTHDSFGNPLVITQIVRDGAGTNLQTDTMTNTYTNVTAGANWLIGLLETSSVTKQRTGQDSVTTETAFDYNYTTGLLTEERHHPNEGVELFLRIKNEYDEFGNQTKVISCSQDLTTTQCSNDTPAVADETNPEHVHRYNRLTYSNDGRYVDETYNTLEQKISDVQSRDIYGNPLTTVDILGRTTTNTYDLFGRLTSTRNTLGEWSQTSRQWCNSPGVTGDLACPAGKNAVIRAKQTTSGGGTAYTYLDIQGREIANIAITFNENDDVGTTGDERWVMSQMWFDQFGRKVKSEGPNFLNANDIPIMEFEYDRYSRPTKVTLPDSSTEELEYDGLAMTMTNGLGHRKLETKNALGQLVEVKDFDQSGVNPNYQNTLSYTYNSLGLVTHVRRISDGSTELLTVNDYDVAGRKESVDDVDSGLTTTVFNAESEPIETEDAKGQILRNYRDELGRVYQTESWDGTTLLTTSTKVFNPTNGLLNVESKYLGNDITPDYTLTHQYDVLNRASSSISNFTDTICGGFNCNYVTSIYYDQYSRIKYQQDASSKAVQNHYSGNGYLERVTDAADASKEYYQIRKTDKWGNISQDRKAGNDELITDYVFNTDRGWLNLISSSVQFYSYDFDQVGNLAKRSDINNDVSECFFYDRLNRLTDSYRFDSFGQNCGNTTGNVEHQIIAYDGSGNITQKDGQTYSYLNANPNSIGSSPHQVQSKGSQSFTYDANGNNTQMSGFTNGSGTTTTRNIEYTAFDRISRIYTGNSLNPFEESNYRYDTSENRFSRIDTNSDGQTNTTHFIGNVEVEYNHNGQVAFKRQLGNYAIITETNSSTQEVYLFNDHLGSVDVITDKEGNTLQHMSYSAWGERRLPASWDQMPLPSVRDYLSDYTTTGFTGHEMLDAFGIINMGGRIYDATLGKVLQADPFVQEPNSSQSFNRYSYVFNNPLSYTDPSGFITAKQFLGAMIGFVVGMVLLPILGPFWAGFFAGFSSSIIITGSLKSALLSGVVAGALAFAGNAFFGKGSGIDAGDPSAPVPGGASDYISSNGFEASNSVANNTPSATGASYQQISTQTAGMSGSAIGEELGKITVIGVTGPAGNLLSEFDAQYWFNFAVNTGSTAFLSDAADQIEQDALSFSEGSISRTNFESTGLQMRDVARMAQGILDDKAMTRAIITGVVVTIATSVIPIGRVVGWAKGAIEAKFKRIVLGRTMQRVAATGRAGEAAVRAVYKIGNKKFFRLANGQGRIPDGVNDVALSEIKNVAKLSYTKQLRDFSAIARSEGLRFDLYVRSTTKLTGPLLEQVKNGNIILKIIPGT